MDSIELFKNIDREESYKELLNKSEGKKIFYDSKMNAWIIFGYNECRQILESPDLVTQKRVNIPLKILGEFEQNRVKKFVDILNSSMMFGSNISKIQHTYWKDFLIRNISNSYNTVLDELSSHLTFNKSTDIAETITYPYNQYCTANIFDLSPEDAQVLLPFARQFAWLLDGKIDTKEDFNKSLTSSLLLYDYFENNILKWKSDFPSYDTQCLIADLLLVYSAAQDTTAHLLNKCIFELANHPQLFSALKTNQIKAKKIIIECLRLLSPISAIGRLAQKDIIINNCKINSGDKLLLYVGYANYDSGIFPEPFNFNLSNTLHAPLSFGHSHGKCIGMQVALTLSEQFLIWISKRITKINVLQTKYAAGTSAIGIDKLICILE